MVDPQECFALYQDEERIRLPRCFFCQRETDDNAHLDGEPLRPTLVTWMGTAKQHTLICRRCMDFLEVPLHGTIISCDFCGYPGGDIKPYTWFRDKKESDCPPYRHTVEDGMWHYRCCRQCREFFARRPLEE